MLETFLLLTMFILVIGLAYFTTRKLASIGKGNQINKNMKILETMQLGINQYLYLVKVGDKMMVIGVSKDGTRYLCSIDSESIDMNKYNNLDNPHLFEEYFNKFLTKRKDKDNT